MKLISNINGETTKPIFLFETRYNVYDNGELIENAKMISVFGKTYFIDERINTEYDTFIHAHKYDTARKIKHELTFVIDWNTLHYHYDISKFDIA